MTLALVKMGPVAMPEALLTVAEMGRADAAAIAGGTPGAVLMEAAGRAVAVAVARRWQPCPVVVLCGPGNNGGDGYVAARWLARAGWPVTVARFGDPARLAGDAAHHARLWSGPVRAMAPDVVDGAGLVVDAIFGAGLSRPVDGVAAATLARAAAAGTPVVAIDVPSGLDGDTGRVRGHAVAAALTVTFFRRKPGHLLQPGRGLCGPTLVADIGIPPAVLDTIAPATFANAPGLWRAARRLRGADDHKYRFGHAVVVGGGRLTGAARLAAHAAARAGAGLVTVAAPVAALAGYAAQPAALLLAADAEIPALLEDPRRNAWLLGPGGGAGPALRTLAATVLAAGRATVLDADALTAFADRPADLFRAVRGPTILTPHDGEFARLFAVQGDRLARARAAAAESGAVVVLKGADTVIAAPDGRAAINGNAPPWLATAGTGDVLAGICVGLLAQGMPAFEAAAMAVWLHGAAGGACGPGLIADDLPAAIPAVLGGLG
ncbi:bifunctional NAD(P)H-hydrate repair enzyme [Allostella vacuolata]|nr:bifunctional NAD(P)H-hydrate repair enzyme [Stella vacuolata]